MFIYTVINQNMFYLHSNQALKHVYLHSNQAVKHVYLHSNQYFLYVNFLI